MDKVANRIKRKKRKEENDKWVKRVMDLKFVNNLVIIIALKWARTQFTLA
jgi:hypothetical protein